MLRLSLALSSVVGAIGMAGLRNEVGLLRLGSMQGSLELRQATRQWSTGPSIGTTLHHNIIFNS